MKSKTLFSLSLSVLVLVLLIGFGSAEVILTPTELIGEGISGQTAEITFTITNEYSSELHDISTEFSDLILDTLTIPSTNLEIIGLDELELDGDEESEDITINIEIPSDQEAGTYNGTVEIIGTLGSGTPQSRGSWPITLTVSEPEPEGYDFCEAVENPGELVLEIKEIEVKEGYGEDDEDGYWYLFDEIEIELEVEPGKWDIEDIEIEWELRAGDKKIMDDEEGDFDLDEDDDEETITFSFKLDDDLDDFEGEDAILYVRAKGKIDDEDAGDYDNKYTCVQDLAEVEVITNDDFVILDNIKINGFNAEDLESTSIPCGDELKITADVWNIGEDKQEDVDVRIYNPDLKIDQRVEFDKIKKFDSEDLEITLKLPEDVEEGTYWIEFTVYDDDNEIYETDEEEDESKFQVYLKVEGNCYSEPTAIVSGGSIESGGKAGQELVAKVTITNTGELATYDLNVAGYADWASSAELDQDLIILAAGQSKDVLIIFDVLKNVEGEKSFDIEVLSEDNLVVKKPVLVSITKGFGFPGITGGAISEGSWYLWGIGALNVILVIIIILVAIKVARK